MHKQYIMSLFASQILHPRIMVAFRYLLSQWRRKLDQEWKLLSEIFKTRIEQQTWCSAPRINVCVFVTSWAADALIKSSLSPCLPPIKMLSKSFDLRSITSFASHWCMSSTKTYRWRVLYAAELFPVCWNELDVTSLVKHNSSFVCVKRLWSAPLHIGKFQNSK